MKGKAPQPRYIKLVKKNRQTGTMIEVDYGMNEANNYQATCYGHVEVTKGGGVNVIVSHGNYINVEDSQASILRLASDPLGCAGNANWRQWSLKALSLRNSSLRSSWSGALLMRRLIEHGRCSIVDWLSVKSLETSTRRHQYESQYPSR